MASKRMAVSSSTAFVLATGLALFLVYQSAHVMHERISSDFNEQQLILARQAAAQIDARLRGITLDLEGMQEYLRLAGDAHLPFLVEQARRRNGAAGMRAVVLVDEAGRITRWWGAADPRPLASAAARCRSQAQAPGRLGPLTLRTAGDGTAVESVLCSPVRGGALVTFVDVALLVGGVTEGIRSGRTGYAWAIDHEGIFLAHADGDFVGRDAFAARHERLPYISFSSIDSIMKDRMLRGEEGTGSYVSGWHRGAQGEIAKLIAYSPVRSAAVPPGAVWSVAVVAPTAEVAEAVRHIYERQLWTQGAVLATLVVFAVTATLYQRRLSLALRARVDHQQEYISSLLQSSMDAIIFIDDGNRVQAWNKGAERIFGYTADEMLGRPFNLLIPLGAGGEEDLDRGQQLVHEKGYMRKYVARCQTKGGREITIDLSRTAVSGGRSGALGSIAVIKDITEKVELDQRIYSAEKLASIGTLAAGVAHELNNPLAIILGFADLLRERLPPGSREYEEVKLIEYNADHARKVVRDMLGFARVTEGLEDTVDLLAAIDTVLTLSASTFITRKISVSRQHPERLPRVRGDPRELQQVVLNLVSNSVAAMQPGGGTLTVRAWRDAAVVHFSIEDSGVGIPERIKARIFDPFFTTKKFGEGTGLGLSLSYGIVKKYGGKISFTSVARDEGGGRPSGTTFTVTMPVADGEAEGALA
jgi:PAS domain S-box-containing protein